MTEQLHFHFSLSCIGKENGNPLQSSCLENPRDGRAWWADIYGVIQSRTRLKQLSSSSSSSRSIAHQAPLSMGFPSQEYWNGLPFPSPGDFSNPGTEPTSTALEGEFFTTEPPRKPRVEDTGKIKKSRRQEDKVQGCK